MGVNGMAATCSQAALGGQINCLKYARENGCEWDSETCKYAAGSSLECLKYARENGREWDKMTCFRAASMFKMCKREWM